MSDEATLKETQEKAPDPAPPQEGFPPLIVDPNRLFPLPQSMWDAHCDHCDKRQSRWLFVPVEMGPPIEINVPGSTRAAGHVICSLCWLYESEWGLKRREHIDAYIREVELESKAVFARAEDGRLWSCRDADRIMGAIALTSRIFVRHHMQMQLRKQMGVGSGGSDGE
jgi:hypothetical protein